MSSSVRRTLCTLLSRVKGLSPHNTTSVRLSSVRALALSSHLESEEKSDEPIKFSTSKASHRTWKVGSSMGSQYRRPWKKVLPLSIGFSVFLLWCVLRGQSDVDENYYRPLQESLQSLQQEQEKAEDKPS
ncbi:unnamed protein product [Knipowitschia caucasica]|uniref:Uncharacterized protein n=1 Tax=Knipowitschia caucasica TaxID=637954 RepID=A0AAV2LFI7_KNICA